MPKLPLKKSVASKAPSLPLKSGPVPVKKVPPKAVEPAVTPQKAPVKAVRRPPFEAGDKVTVSTVYAVKRIDDKFVYLEDEALDRVLTFRITEVKKVV